ncbi:hypothetical protein MJ581_21110 [Escherichia coli]|nr:hypothetical protein MJ581_21110 [Escherichia coli]
MIGEIEGQTESAPPSWPGFKHLTTVNTFNEQAFKDHFGPVDRHIRWWNTASQYDRRGSWCRAWYENASGAPDISKPTLKAFGHAQFCHHIIEVLFSDVNRTGDTHLRASSRLVFVIR